MEKDASGNARGKGLAPERLNDGVNRWGSRLRVVKERAMGTVLERDSWVRMGGCKGE